MNIRIDQLVIEITRECNAACKHCLRGKQEKVKIKKNDIKTLLSQVEGVRSITFSGGEPTLNIKAIRDTLNIVKELKVPVDSIYVVTNGIKYSKGLVRVMNDWLQYCIESTMGDSIDRKEISSFITRYRLESELYGDAYVPNWFETYRSESYFGLAVSIDRFHPTSNREAYRLYSTLPYYAKDKEHNLNEKDRYLINEGNAKKNGIGTRDLKKSDFSLDFYEDDCLVELLYLNALGFVLPECNLSYRSQKQWKPCSIAEFSLQEILSAGDKSCVA